MTETPIPQPAREILHDASAEAVLQRLPRMGRLMVVLQTGGVTHERIGPVESVSCADDGLHISGPCHAAVIDTAPVASVGIDRSSVMKDKVYPRLNFRDADGEVLFAVVGMEGLEPFKAALTGFARSAEPPPDAAERSPRADLAGDDPLHAPFNTLVAAGAEAVITASTTGIRQSWQGRVEATKPAMGFLNVMTGDFHLHLAGGSVSAWAAEPGRRIALGPEGQPTGLILASDAFA